MSPSMVKVNSNPFGHALTEPAEMTSPGLLSSVVSPGTVTGMMPGGGPSTFSGME